MSRVEEALMRAAVEGRDGHGAAAAPLSVPATEHVPLDSFQREARDRDSERIGRAAAPAPPPLDRTERVDQAQVRLAAHEPGKLILGKSADPLAVEQYRRLAGNLHQLQVQDGLKTLMVTSAAPREGKTLTVANLALTLSESYHRRVLVIDADLRRPTVHQLFDVAQTPGLTEVLNGLVDTAPVQQVSRLLSVLPSGHPTANPLAGLTSERMQLLLERCAALFDWVLLDAPPVGMMPDAHLLASVTRAALFVILAGSTSYKYIDRALTELGRDFVVGTVLNRVAAHQVSAHKYYSDYYA